MFGGSLVVYDADGRRLAGDADDHDLAMIADAVALGRDGQGHSAST